MQNWIVDYAERLERISEAEADAPREGRTWTRKQELGHLIDSAINNHNRIVRAALDGVYSGPGYDADGWVEMNAYQERDWALVIALWRDLNFHLANAVERVSPSRLGAACVIGGSEPVTREFLIADYRDHMEQHLAKILA